LIELRSWTSSDVWQPDEINFVETSTAWNGEPVALTAAAANGATVFKGRSEDGRVARRQIASLKTWVGGNLMNGVNEDG